MFYVYELKNTLHVVDESNTVLLNELTTSEAGYKLLGKIDDVSKLVKEEFSNLDIAGLNPTVAEKLANAPVLDKKVTKK